MPSATDMVRAYRYPRKLKVYQGFDEFDPSSRRSLRVRSDFAPGTVFDLFDEESNRIGYGRIGPDGTIDLFDLDSNRIGLIRSSVYRQFEQVVSRIIHEHPTWTHDEIIREYRRRTMEAD